jgi:two-component system cell cycle sensor histidine kinase/response regulator CckA
MKKQTTSQKDTNRYRDILENITEGYFEVDLAGNFTFINPSMAKILGYSVHDLLGLNYKAYMSEENIQKVYTAFNETYRTGCSVMQFDGRHVRKNGSAVDIETSVSLLRDEEGLPSGFRGIAHDITERKKMEQQLIQMQKMEAIGTLAGGIAHDFNNLLMGIQGYTFLMLRDLKPDHPHYQKLLRIEEQVRNGAELTRQLLGFAREGQYEVKPVNLEEILSQTSLIFGQTKKDIKILSNCDRALWTVEVDQGQIEQVLLGLYLNAWEAMPGGGTLSLEAHNVTLNGGGYLPFSMIPGAYVKVSIRDTGVGMDERTQARIFEPFFTTKEMGRGVGLGLASVYGIIKGHGGFIDVTSKIGEGTTFDLYLPVSGKKATPVQEPHTSAEQGKETILLIDDEEVIIDISREILEMLGYRVLTASTGYEAIAQYTSRKNEIDLVILDMIMPSMSGGDTFDQLKKVNPQIKVILSTGYSLTGQAREIMARGCLGFIQKPFRVETLAQKIREVLDMTHPQKG